MRTEPRITFIGHATLLIEIAGMRILTDPIVRGRIGHLVRRVPAPEEALLDSVDLVLVSHAHHDHLDGASLKHVGGSPMVLVPPDGSRAVGGAGLRHAFLAAGQRDTFGSVTVEATHAEHDGRRWGFFGDPTSVGYIVRAEGQSVYFAGDTDLFPQMRDLGPVDIALIPVSGWGPKIGPGHIGPREAAEAAAMVRPRVAIPIHFGTIARIGMRRPERPDRPATEFAEHVAELAPEVDVRVLKTGDSYP